MHNRPLEALAALASLPYGLAVRARHALYDAGLLTQHRAPMPVISVGALEAGGTGKTPMVALLLRRLLEAGLRPGLLTRGYRRHSRGLVVRAQGAAARPEQLGDEAAMLVVQGLDVAVAACARRTVGARALAALGCDAAVMDDGLSHRALGRALNIVMVRGELPLQAARLLPWGSLREPVAHLRRADLVVVLHRQGRAPCRPPAALARLLATWVGARPVLMAEHAPPCVRDAEGRDRTQELAHLPVVAAAATARPLEIAAAVEALGGALRAFYPFEDHHPFGPQTLGQLHTSCRAHGAQALVVTAKDAVKLPAQLGDTPVWTLHRPLRLWDPEDLLGGALHTALGASFFIPPRNTPPLPPDTFK